MPSGADGSSEVGREGLVERVDGIAGWINELDTRVRAAELATSDEKTAKELRRAVEALSNHDPKLEKRLTNRVDVLADRLATLASTVSTTAASVVRKDGEIASLRKDLEDANKRLEALVREFGKSAGADEVEKLRAAIRTVQAERPARTSDARVEGLGAKVEYLTERVDTLAKTVATTAAGLVGREGEIAALRHRLDEGSARIEQASVELRRLQGDGSVTRRLDALQTGLDDTNAGLGARENDVVALRSRIDEAYSRVGTVVAELQGSIATLSSHVKALEALPGETEQALDAQAVELNARVDGLARRVESLATNVESAMSGLVDRAVEIGALTKRADEASERVDLVVAELRQALAQLPVPGSVEGEVEARLEELGRSMAAITGQLAGIETSSSAQAGEAVARAGALEELVAEAGERLQALERDRDSVAEQLEQAGAAWSDEREWVRTRLRDLAAADAGATTTRIDFGQLLDELGARLGVLESEHGPAATELARLSAALEAERGALQTQLERFAAELARVAAGSDEGSERMLGELTTRLNSLEEDGAAVASEIARTTALWASELEAMETRLDRVTGTLGAGAESEHVATERLLSELGDRLDTVETDRQAAAAEMARVSGAWETERASLEARLGEIATHLAALDSDPRGGTTASEGEVAELRVAVDGLRMRLASSEQELAALVGTRDTSARLDELTRRLEALERAPVVLAGAADGTLPGDGRFRLELRALELRMEHGEAAARENREAVLVQLERLAARIEWRFHRLEAEYEAAHPHAVGGGGQVVPIRPADA